MISICVPYHDISETELFLERLKGSLKKQTYKDWELILTKNGRMAENTNSAISQAKGDIIKILYMDDYLLSPDALQHIADNLQHGWLASACVHDDGYSLSNVHVPKWNDEILKGINEIGSPSVVAFENKDVPLMDENLDWVVDCDWYYRMEKRFGKPTLLKDIDIAIGVGIHQTTYKLTDTQKIEEVYYLKNKYG